MIQKHRIGPLATLVAASLLLTAGLIAPLAPAQIDPYYVVDPYETPDDERVASLDEEGAKISGPIAHQLLPFFDAVHERIGGHEICPCPEPVEASGTSAGQADDFHAGDPGEQTTPRTALSQAHPGGSRDFDQAGNDVQFMHSFSGLDGYIVGAFLDIHMRAEGYLASNDGLQLGAGGDATTWRDWTHPIGDRTGQPGLVDGVWRPGQVDEAVISLNLKNLPNRISQGGGTTSLIDGLNQNEFLDVRIADDTAVDWIRLTIYTCPCTEAPASMTAWWSMDEGQGVTAFDRLGTHHGDLSPVNTPGLSGPQHITGMVDGALHFDGVDDRVTVPDHNALDMGTSSISIDAWIQPNATAAAHPIVDKMATDVQTGAGAHGYQFSLWLGTLAFSYSTATNVFNTVTCTGCAAELTPGDWSLVAVTFDRGANEIVFYVDGQPVDTVTGVLPGNDWSNGQPLTLGAGDMYLPGHFTGALDEVELFDRVLGPEEVERLSFAESAGKCKQDCDDVGDVTLQAGRVDDFDTSDGAEPADPSAMLQNRLQTCSNGPAPNFDGTSWDRCFGHTFDLAPYAGSIQGAILTFKASQRNGLAHNDGIKLKMDGNGDFWEQRRVTDVPGFQWDQDVSWDLSTIPGMLGQLNQDGWFDFFLADDSSVDYLQLTLILCENLEPKPTIYATVPGDAIYGIDTNLALTVQETSSVAGYNLAANEGADRLYFADHPGDLNEYTLGSGNGVMNALPTFKGTALGEGRDGLLYFGQPNTADFYSIEPGVAITYIGTDAAGGVLGGDIATSPSTGVMYGTILFSDWTGPGLVTVNKATGQQTFLGSLNLFGFQGTAVDGLAFDCDGELWANSGSELYLVDPVSTTASFVMDLGFVPTDLASQPNC